MRIVILGGGVVGVTTAYQLQRDGHEVELLERNGLTAAGTSWGNAGMIAPGRSFVWSSPKAPLILLKSLFQREAALRFRFSADPHFYRWLWAFLRECTSEKARRNTLAKHRLAAYSQRVLGEVVKAERLEYDRDQRGILYFYRSPEALDRGVAAMKLLEADGQRFRVLDRQQILEFEPNINADGIAGAIYGPTDETGDPAKFTRALAARIAERGGAIRTGVTVLGIDASGGRVDGVLTDKGPVKGDAYVLALGSESPLLARRIGLDLPVYPVKGYSLTVPIGNRPRPPTLATIDERHAVAVSRFGDRMRVTATAEFAGYDTSHKPTDFAFVKRVIEDLYPEGGDYDRAEMWAGLRPMTPTDLPLLGRRGFDNLYLNTGHGHIGWTSSHGSARIVADLVAGRRPEIPIEGLLN